MAIITGILALDEENKLCVKVQISQWNAEPMEVPLEELLEEYIGKEVHIEILPVEKRWRWTDKEA
jgi:hypothetical protein